MTKQIKSLGQERQGATSGVDKSSSLFVASFEKGISVLRAFDHDHRAMRLIEIAAASGLDKSATQRFVHTLRVLGYLRQDPRTKLYSLSPKILELGFAYMQGDPLIERAMPYLHECNSQSGETVNLSELSDLEIIFVARVPGRHALNVDVMLGSSFPAYCTAPGRAMLAFLREDQALDIIDRSSRHAITPHTITDKAKLCDRLKSVRDKGYSLANQEVYIGDISIAAPVFDFTGVPVAALNISAPSPRWSVKRVEKELAPLVTHIAGEISGNDFIRSE